MSARWMRSLYMAAVLLSVGQLSPARAATLTFSSENVNFGDVTVGTTETIPVTATFTLDTGFDSVLWDLRVPPSSFSAPNNCDVESTTCVVDVSFSPTTSGSFSDALTFSGLEFSLTTGLSGGVADAFVNLSGTGVPAATPLPAGLPLFATGLGALGLLGWYRKRKALA